MGLKAISLRTRHQRNLRHPRAHLSEESTNLRSERAEAQKVVLNFDSALVDMRHGNLSMHLQSKSSMLEERFERC